MILVGFVKVGKKKNSNGFPVSLELLKKDQFICIYNLKIMKLDIWENQMLSKSILIKEWYLINQKIITFLLQI